MEIFYAILFTVEPTHIKFDRLVRLMKIMFFIVVRYIEFPNRKWDNQRKQDFGVLCSNCYISASFRQGGMKHVSLVSNYLGE